MNILIYIYSFYCLFLLQCFKGTYVHHVQNEATISLDMLFLQPFLSQQMQSPSSRNCHLSVIPDPSFSTNIMPIQWCFLNIPHLPSPLSQSSLVQSKLQISVSLNCFNGLVTDPPLPNFAPLKSHLPATSKTILSQMSKFCLTQALFKIFSYLHICHRTMVKLQIP